MLFVLTSVRFLSAFLRIVVEAARAKRSAIPDTSNCSPDFWVKTCANFEESKKAS